MDTKHCNYPNSQSDCSHHLYLQLCIKLPPLTPRIRSFLDLILVIKRLK